MLPEWLDPTLVALFGCSAAGVAVLSVYAHMRGEGEWVGMFTRRQTRMIELVLTGVMLASLAVLLV